MEVFFFMFLLLVVGGAITLSAQQEARKQALFDRFAGAHGGRLLTAGSWFGQPRVQLGYRGLPVHVEQTSTGGKHPIYYIEASLQVDRLNRDSKRVSIYPEAFVYSLGKLLGMQDLEIGVSWFDETYILQSNDLMFLKRFLDEETRGAIEALRGLFGNGDIYVLLEANRLLVKKMRYVTEEGDLESVFSLCLPIFDSMLRGLDAERLLEAPVRARGVYMVPDSAGIRFLPETAEGVGAEGTPGIVLLPDREGIRFLGVEEAEPPAPTCPVCGELLEGRVVVRCRSCKTQHHHDCWEFNGRCSTYGCRSESSERG